MPWVGGALRPPARQRALRCHARLPPLEPDPPRLGCVLALVRARCAMRVSRPPPPALSCCCCCCRRLQPRAGLNKHAAGGVALAALAHAVLVCARGERPHACMPAIQAHSRPRPQSPHTPQCLLQGPPGRARPHLLGERWVVVCVGGGGGKGARCWRLLRAAHQSTRAPRRALPARPCAGHARRGVLLRASRRAPFHHPLPLGPHGQESHLGHG